MSFLDDTIAFALQQPAPWAIAAEAYVGVHLRVAAGFQADGMAATEIERRLELSHGLEFDPSGRVAVQYVSGVFYAGASPELEYWYGLYNTARIQQACADIRATKGIRALVLVIDSPGGYSRGVDEAANDLAKLRSEGIPVFAFVKGTAASAAYWIAASANVIGAPTHAEVGSIGTYVVTYDSSAYFSQMGVDVRVHRDGELKGMGVAGKEWTPAEYAWVQQRVKETSSPMNGPSVV